MSPTSTNSFDPSVDSRESTPSTLTSKKGRQWLQQSLAPLNNSAITPDEPRQPIEIDLTLSQSEQLTHELNCETVIAIPELGDVTRHPSSGLDVHEYKVNQSAQQAKREPNRAATEQFEQGAPRPVAPPQQLAEPTATKAPLVDLTCDLTEPPDDWSSSPDRDSDTRKHNVKENVDLDLATPLDESKAGSESKRVNQNTASEAASATSPANSAPVAPGSKTLHNSPSTAASDDAIAPLVTSILEKFPLASPAVLLFVGSEANVHIDETCARTSSLLADKHLGRILLIDSDIRSKALSQASGVDEEEGISDAVARNVPWKQLTYGGSATGLDFLPAGTNRFNHPDSKARLRKIIAEMKSNYQFICVSAGDAHSRCSRLWHDLCDGSYLLVSMKNSHEAFAKSAVTELQTSGARLLGCVVTDAD